MHWHFHARVSTVPYLFRRTVVVPLLNIVLLLSALPGNAAKPPDPPAPKSIPELKSRIEAVLKETHTPGAGIGIVSRDEVQWVAGIGQADVAANKPADADTLFRIGSVTKAFAALAALQLQEQGKLQF